MTYHLKREIPIETGWDLVIAGGGPGGAAAAICAARLGAKVLLVEAMGCLGGMGTSGLVCAFDPMADGEKPLVGGFVRELVETLYERGFLQADADPAFWRRYYHCWTGFRAEGLKMVYDELAADAGVEVRFFTKVIDADASPESGLVSGIITHNVEGYRYIKSKAFIDATGDAVLSVLSGAEYREALRDTDHIMPSTLTALFSGVDWKYGWFDSQSEECVKLIEEEYEKGNFEQLDRFLVGMAPHGEATGYLNGGHLYGLRSTNIRSLSDGMVKGRRIVRQCMEFLKKYAPGCKNIELVATAALMGVRESRRIVGEYELVFDDFINRRQFHDQIGVFNKHVDIHPYDCSKEEHERFWEEKKKTAVLGVGECFGIPYGILVPKGFKNLWVAGRCNSSDVMAHGSIRVMPACGMMGQAAGTAAVQSINTGEPACGLNTETLVQTLRENKAYLPQKTTGKNMTKKT
ncbi:MAG: FAD-dependent oxidoreductase [Defluviitaleaceae bacterium]|nr:FAD-dependent oxidoreductase [Defluviitaleaceae bacterium]